MAVAPQLQKRAQWIDEVLAPKIRTTLLRFAHRMLNFTLEHAVGAISDRELADMQKQVDALLRDVTREGYIRRREESIDALKDTIPDEKHRVALLDDILREYPEVDDSTTWTELKVETKEDGTARLRLYDSDGDSSGDEGDGFKLVEGFVLKDFMAVEAAKAQEEQKSE
jgi:hypothetical protein